VTTEKRDFDREAASWDDRPARVKLAKEIADAIQRQVPATSEMDALDFGCGTGLLTIQLQPFVRSITGVDSSQGMLDVLNDNIAKLKLNNVRTLRADFQKGDALTGNYNLIVSNMTLHHIKDIRPLFNQFYKAMAPSGYLCIADLDPEHGQFHEDNTGVFHFGFDRAELRETFIEAGFDSIRDIPATRMAKSTGDEKMREFSVFLMSGVKRQ
jgi:ubiquinone/menaquinone biosynthesis C-methylase UbiE